MEPDVEKFSKIYYEPLALGFSFQMAICETVLKYAVIFLTLNALLMSAFGYDVSGLNIFLVRPLDCSLKIGVGYLGW